MTIVSMPRKVVDDRGKLTLGDSVAVKEEFSAQVGEISPIQHESASGWYVL